MAIHIEELNSTNCKTYLLTVGNKAALVDPVRERLETYRQVLADRGLELTMILETHTHADHLMFNRAMKDSLGVPFIMHNSSPRPEVDRHVDHGDTIDLGSEVIQVLHTPGHTPDSLSLVVPGAVLTGDTLMINGSGRTDFPGGDPGAQFDAISDHLFALADDTIVWPGHDYRGNTQTTIGEQKRNNPRISGKSRVEYIDIMNNLGLPLPTKIQAALQVNQSGFEADQVTFPTYDECAKVGEVTATELAAARSSSAIPLVIDVREPEEFVGDLGHIEGALLVPMDSLQPRLPKLSGYIDQPVVVVCRAGARSVTACAILINAGFGDIKNLTGGMLAWVEADQPVQR
jgi:glyoxylase-like metal-dependent hydrolase (beta-lactamase superfamily II)/rhodanese-related sulfurtransferase